jgi:hypothetical protein
MSPEKPRPARFEAGLPATVRHDGVELPCTARDLSRKGLLLVGNLPTPRADVVELTVRSTGGDLELGAVGRVVRIDQDPDSGEALIGVEFLERPPVDRRTLEALIARAVEGMAPAALERLPAGATPQQIREALERVPLPHRVSLARRAGPHERERLRHDGKLQVIDALARNPSILQHELLALLRRPDLLPHTLEAISLSPRWRGDAQVRVLVASHRNTPLPVADRIVSSMSEDALQKVIRAPDLQPGVRAKVLGRMKGRRR